MLEINIAFTILCVTILYTIKETFNSTSKLLALSNLSLHMTIPFKIRIWRIQLSFSHYCQAKRNSLQGLPWLMKISLFIPPLPYLPQISFLSKSLAFLQLCYIFPLGTPNTETPLPTQIQATPTSETPVLVPASDRNQVPSTFEDSESDLSDALSSDKEQQTAPRQSAHTGANQFDYKKYFQNSKAATAKTNLSVLIGSPHSKASHILFDYALNQPEK